MLSIRIVVFLMLSLSLSFIWTAYAEDLSRILEDAEFTRRVELGITSSFCLVSEKGEKPVVMVGLWWGPDRTITLTPEKLSDILQRSIDITRIKLLDRKGRPISSGAKNHLELRISKEPQFLVIEGPYDRLPSFPDNLSLAKVYMHSSSTSATAAYAVFENLILNATIQIFDATNQIILEVTNLNSPTWTWDLRDSRDKNLSSGTYKYKIIGKNQAVSGRLVIGN